MKRYGKYKDSAVQWLGKVPSHWNYSRIKFGLKSSFSGVWGDDEKGDDNDVVCYRVADFDYKNGGLSEEKITIRNIDEKTFKEREILPNDILIEKSGGGDVNPVGRAVIANLDHKATCSNFIHCVRCNENVLNTRLLYYFFYSIYVQKVNLLFFNQTTGIQNLKVPEYLGQVMFLPPLSEQQSIASFLDAKTKPIDDIIAKREQQIALLEEMKSAIISRAVTKGLNPEAKMKDSGIEWIGEVPENWNLLRFRLLCRISTGDSDTQDAEPDGEYPFYVRSPQVERRSKFTCEGDAILMAGDGAGAGRVFHHVDGKYAVHQRVYIFNQFNKVVDSNYLYQFMRIMFPQRMNMGSAQSTVPSVRLHMIQNFVVPIPSIDEQRTIASYLDTETAKIDVRIDKRRKQIALLQEYKQALITDAVTGKIDVRGFSS